ncbi:ribonuclease D [Oharaeibacter diazotrophicus]|uniref:Ribonuclease D n=1 Tax=Oharaeibacter diazotrophicus TaxID=1920512 RepID=A0A4R6RMK6_9HYPH|nr:ribonuclease D [Oharaeibacter diazotrophicus]TDP87405.1 ribonuclease D [Oharaeibacter diazotrophicus]BBE70652.1 ribonuclease D [Pleomorphomonas sp. SM30]GLS77398.1 ribonuclease D [Oharaeibacter diazotrophicus]
MTMITTISALAEACTHLARFDAVTVDTEFLRETTFWPKLCVVQMASPERAFVVDALAPGLDLSPFFDLMRDEAVLKVFHAARQDIEIIWHLGGFVPHPVFDTQVAAMVCGFGDSISYDQLVARVSGAHIDKTHRFTDWTRRPLSASQLAYAEADVTHLRDVYRHLAATLERKGRTDWVAEEMEVLTSPETYRSDPDEAWLRLRMRLKKSRELIVLKEVAAWREREAQGRDVPRSRVLKDDTLFEIATHAPTTVAALGELRTVPRGWERSRAGEDVVAAVTRALEIPKEQWPRAPKGRQAPEGSGAVVDLLKVLLKQVSDDEGVAAKIIATVDELEEIAADDGADVPALRGWRRELFGERALAVKRGEIAFAYDGKRVVTVEMPGRAPAAAKSAAE